MKLLPLFLFLAFAAALPARAGTPKCPPLGSGGVSADWGADYREHILEIFNAAKSTAGITQPVLLINVNDLQKKNGGVREVDGSPISALPKGTQGLPEDAIIYTFGVFEIACDEAQLATFMLHEMRHIKRGPDGKNHFDRVDACRKELTGALRARAVDYPDEKSAVDAFQKKCVFPVEKEADQFAFETLPKLPYEYDGGSDPNRDARAQAFKNAETWSAAIGAGADDPGHGSLSDREKAAAAAVVKQRDAQRQAAERIRAQSIDPSDFNPGN